MAAQVPGQLSSLTRKPLDEKNEVNLFSELETNRLVYDGLHTWVKSEGKEYIRKNGVWELDVVPTSQEYVSINSITTTSNSVTINAVSSNTTKTIEYLHPTTNVWQDSNILTNVPNGTYTNLKVRLKTSNPAIISTYYGTIIVTGSTTTQLFESQFEGQFE